MAISQTISPRENAVILDFELGRQRFQLGLRSRLKNKKDNGTITIIPFHSNDHTDIVPNGDDAA